jgi:hypothetical protein
MGLGLLLLVSVGKENIYLSTQPEITFFKIAYKRYTNFFEKTIDLFGIIVFMSLNRIIII